MDHYELERYFDNLLDSQSIRDYAPNGLQVEGKKEVNNVAFGVTASKELITSAIQLKADAIVVHHGYFWKGESQPLVGMKYQRIKQLINHNINLYAYHLPLDMHVNLGNNAQLAKVLDISNAKPVTEDGLLWLGELKKQSAEQFKSSLSHHLDREPLLINGGSHQINKIAWCSGGAQGYIDKAKAHQADAFFSGEISEKTFHEAKELGIHYYSAGHHATEIWGVKALSEQLNEDYPHITTKFINIKNPV